MRLSEILKEEKERCVTCDGSGKEFVGDDQLVFDCPDCKGVGYFDVKEDISDAFCDRCDGQGKMGYYGKPCVKCGGTGKKEELEEIKVTKTVAGKRATASQTLAGKLKKKMPNQGKKPVELDKMKDAKELANNLLKGQYRS